MTLTTNLGAGNHSSNLLAYKSLLHLSLRDTNENRADPQLQKARGSG
jgi:hypothetical protein